MHPCPLVYMLDVRTHIQYERMGDGRTPASARSHLLDTGSPVDIFRGHSVPTEVGRPANLRQLDSVPNTRSDECRSPPTALARSSCISVFGHPPEQLLLSGYCPANSNHCR